MWYVYGYVDQPGLYYCQPIRERERERERERGGGGGGWRGNVQRSERERGGREKCVENESQQIEIKNNMQHSRRDYM